MQWEKNFQYLQEQRTQKEKEVCWRNLRNKSFQSFKQLGYPSLKTEDWQYTRLEHLKKASFCYPERNNYERNISESLKKEIQKRLLPESLHFVFIDSHFEKNLSTSLNQVPKGMFFLPLEDFLLSPEKTTWPQEHFKKAQQFLMEDSQKKTDFSSPFFQLNGAFLQKGGVFYFEKDFQSSSLLQLLFVFTQEREEFFHIRNGFFLESHSKVQLAQSYLSLKKEPLFINSAHSNDLSTKFRDAIRFFTGAWRGGLTH